MSTLYEICFSWAAKNKLSVCDMVKILRLAKNIDCSVFSGKLTTINFKKNFSEMLTFIIANQKIPATCKEILIFIAEYTGDLGNYGDIMGAYEIIITKNIKKELEAIPSHGRFFLLSFLPYSIELRSKNKAVITRFNEIMNNYGLEGRLKKERQPSRVSEEDYDISECFIEIDYSRNDIECL